MEKKRTNIDKEERKNVRKTSISRKKKETENEEDEHVEDKAKYGNEKYFYLIRMVKRRNEIMMSSLLEKET